MPTRLPRLAVSLLVLVATTTMSLRFADAETAAVIPPAAPKEAGEIYTARCASCHGATGKGDGAAATGLNPKPRNYSDPAWQASVTDERALTTS